MRGRGDGSCDDDEEDGDGDCDCDGGGLSLSDLYAVPRSMRSSHLVLTFDEYHERYGLRRALWNVARPTFLPAGACQLIVVICGVAMPLLIRDLVRIVESNVGSSITRHGLPYAFSIFATSVFNGLASHRQRHMSTKSGLSMRIALINAIYVKSLYLSPEGRSGLSSGEISNLMAVDSQKIYEVAQEGHLIWSLPLSILLVGYFLLDIIGISALSGIAVLVTFVPIIERVTASMMKIRARRLTYADVRVELISSMLRGMRVTKLNNREDGYLRRVTEVRDDELRCLSREMAVWATTLLITVTSPILATAACFTTYVLIDDDHEDGSSNVLTTSDAFGVLLLFLALRFPINFAGRLMGKVAQASSAADRISAFLDRPSRRADDDRARTTRDGGDGMTTDATNDDVATSKFGGDDCADVPLRLEGAAFRIGGVACGMEEEEEEEEEEVVDDDDLDEVRTSSSPVGFKVSKFDFSLSKGEVLAVCGPVGSGKSTLLNGILGEARSVGTTGGGVSICGRVSYVPQIPFVLNTSLRDNILFGRQYEKEWYDMVLDACCLRPDLEQLRAGDATEIGERGVTLSGGQKQRVCLARAAYAKSDLVVLDDPFSALDAGTGGEVFDRLIGSTNGLLRDSAVLLVTHASHLMTNRAVGRILLIVDGRNRFVGTWDELTDFSPHDERARRAVDHIRSSVREDERKGDGGGMPGEDRRGDDTVGKAAEKGRLIQAETREHGLSSLRTWLLWFKRAGGLPFFMTQLIFMAVDRLAYVAIDFFLAIWTSGAEKSMAIAGIQFPPQTDGQGRYLVVYWSLILVSALATFLRSEWGVVGGGRATRYVFNNMLASVLRAPMSYFERIPMGRIMNRFTYDTDVNDVNLTQVRRCICMTVVIVPRTTTRPHPTVVITQVMSMLMISCSWYVAGVIIQCTILPWCFFVIAPVSVMYWVLMKHYRLSGPDLQRLDALSRSPLQSMVSEGLEGSTSIRVFCQADNFVKKFRNNADANCSALLNFVSAQRWLAVRMELMGSVVVLVSSVLVVCLNDVLKLEPGLIAILILWSANFTITLNFLVDTFSDAEASITAIERVDAMAYLPSEKAMKTDDANRPPSSWPEKGFLEFVDVSLRYRPDLPLTLDRLSFKIPAGKTCGVVGRTGAGKSSLAVALFRLVEVESGNILLDGLDLGNLGLCDVRGRGMAIIPQDSFLAGATIRDCLDPFGQHEDEEIMDALVSVRLGDDKVRLSMKLEEGGSNFSVGECQLLNLARALLSQPKLLVLDEATASIDGETDAFIQKMLRTRFGNTTLVTIAHRINTIMDYDLILVMDAGRAVEFGPPTELLDIRGGVFSELVDATGGESSKGLRAMAKKGSLSN